MNPSFFAQVRDEYHVPYVCDENPGTFTDINAWNENVLEFTSNDNYRRRYPLNQPWIEASKQTSTVFQRIKQSLIQTVYGVPTTLKDKAESPINPWVQGVSCLLQSKQQGHLKKNLYLYMEAGNYLTKPETILYLPSSTLLKPVENPENKYLQYILPESAKDSKHDLLFKINGGPIMSGILRFVHQDYQFIAESKWAMDKSDPAKPQIKSLNNLYVAYCTKAFNGNVFYAPQSLNRAINVGALGRFHSFGTKKKNYIDGGIELNVVNGDICNLSGGMRVGWYKAGLKNEASLALAFLGFTRISYTTQISPLVTMAAQFITSTTTWESHYAAGLKAKIPFTYDFLPSIVKCRMNTRTGAALEVRWDLDQGVDADGVHTENVKNSLYPLTALSIYAEKPLGDTFSYFEHSGQVSFGGKVEFSF